MSFQETLLQYDFGEHVVAFSTMRDAVLPFDVVQGHQVHGDKIAIVDHLLSRDELEGYDAFITQTPGLAIAARTADCVPILLYDSTHAVVAAVHAGWKGTVLRISETVLKKMHKLYGTLPADVKAVIGPSIGFESFQVGKEVVEAFQQAGYPVNDLAKYCGPTIPDTMQGGWHLDLWQANRWLLLASGLLPHNIHLAAIDTYTDPRFFSARREGLSCGRILNVIQLTVGI